MKKFFEGSLCLAAFMGGVILTKYFDSKELLKIEKEKEKYSLLMNVYTRWIMSKSRGREISSRLLQKGYHKVAIYGIAGIGKTLYMDLYESAVDVCYFIDKQAGGNVNSFRGKPVIRIQDIQDMEEVDAIVVTPFYVYDQIKDDLDRAGITCPVISIETMVI